MLTVSGQLVEYNPLSKAEIEAFLFPTFISLFSFVQAADGFLLVYDVSNAQSFEVVDQLKKFLDRQSAKEKSNVSFFILKSCRFRV